MGGDVSSIVNERLFGYIQAKAGVVLDDHRRDAIRQVIAEQIQTLGQMGTETLIELLERTSLTHALWQSLIRPITIGETYFFRNRGHFEALRTSVLPNLISERRKSGLNQLRIWSAGCSTGEEPYSIAMLLRDLIPDIDGWSILILATDINADSLYQAKEGLYSARSFRGETPEEIKDRWFVPDGNRHRLSQTIRDMVLFSPLNLINDAYPSFANNTMHMDIVICRNVTIYFKQEETKKIVDRFWASLSFGGWLIIGHSEPHLETYHAFTPKNFANAVLYQKLAKPIPQQVPQSNGWVKSEVKDEKKPVKPQPVVESKPRRELAAKKPVEIEKQEKPESGTDAWTRAKKAADNEHWDLALELLTEAEGDDILQPQVHYLRSLIFLHINDLPDAVLGLRQAIYCDPSFTLAHYTLGDVFARQGNISGALKCWKQAHSTLKGLEPELPIPFAEDLTVEMLRGMLEFRMRKL